MIRRHPWIASLALSAFAIALVCWFFQPKPRPDQKAVALAEAEVYATVVRDLVTPTDGPANLSQLVFSETVLTQLEAGENIKACERSVRDQVRVFASAPPYNTFADNIYRMVTLDWRGSSLRSDTIEDFVQKSCDGGPLSKTFRTDFPRVFVNPHSVGFGIAPDYQNGRQDFRQAFPGAGGLISLSRVGFDTTLDEAVVSTSFVCGTLCGSGRRYTLRKKWGKWEIISKPILWVS
jgi:hypothetical protein